MQHRYQMVLLVGFQVTHTLSRFHGTDRNYLLSILAYRASLVGCLLCTFHEQSLRLRHIVMCKDGAKITKAAK
jgi:hypothetical protein